MEIRKEQFLAALMAFGIGTAGCKKDEPEEEPIEDTAGDEEPMMDPAPVDNEPIDDGMNNDGEEVYDPVTE